MRKYFENQGVFLKNFALQQRMLSGVDDMDLQKNEQMQVPKRVLITGGTRGIGKAMVERFCADGHHVAFLYRNSVDAAKALSDKASAIGIRADLSCAEEAEKAVRQGIEALGGVDILINNAGISQIKLFTDLTDSDWQTMVDTNLSGAFYATREAVKFMISQQFGRVLFIGSMWGKVGASCEVSYSATKAALRGMTMALAKELGPSHITVNCIEPGLIMTEMNATLSEETIRGICEDTPLCRAGTPEEVAALAAFLASEEASFITAQCIGIDGGLAV